MPSGFAVNLTTLVAAEGLLKLESQAVPLLHNMSSPVMTCSHTMMLTTLLARLRGVRIPAKSLCVLSLPAPSYVGGLARLPEQVNFSFVGKLLSDMMTTS
jgi:hypothetical protein